MAETFTPITTSNLANQSSVTAAIDQNFAAIAALLQDVLSLAGTLPNAMKSTLDMNGNAIVNLTAPVTINSPARLVDVMSNPTISVPPVGTSGAVVGLLNGTNTWSGLQTFGGVTFNTAPTFATTVTFANGVTFSGNNTYNGTSTFTKAVTINTAVGQLFNASSANTGGTNSMQINNSGDSSNVLTIAELNVNLSGLTNGAVNLYIEGGVAPISQLNINSGITGGFNLVSVHQLTLQSLTAGATLTGNTAVGIEVPTGTAIASFQAVASTLFNPVILQSTLIINSLTAVGTGASPTNIFTATTSSLTLTAGTGAPTAAAPKGSIYIRTDGSSSSTRLYVNTDGSTTWTNVTTAG